MKSPKQIIRNRRASKHLVKALARIVDYKKSSQGMGDKVIVPTCSTHGGYIWVWKLWFKFL